MDGTAKDIDGSLAGTIDIFSKLRVVGIAALSLGVTPILILNQMVVIETYVGTRVAFAVTITASKEFVNLISTVNRDIRSGH